ncbi:tether containing UBX domain for GLUT4 [Periplaneta americana]|uniref:tether containing UBX domain for GLUT4 n=1 Tax=Periplaneta americana TaxID=6978 RepID=UPI0037E9167F
MASIKCVIVLAPNGRRQTVKVTPNTTILQVLEEVCNKQGFDSEEYVIKHHNHILDTNAIIRFSGLPNNAQLEMATAKTKRQETNVTIGLQVENGNRLMGDFLPSDSLWNVIIKLCPDEADPNSNPVIIYMRREVSGSKDLQETTLRSLGLTSGRAMLRYVHRTSEELHQQANVSAPLPQRSLEKGRLDDEHSESDAKSASSNSKPKVESASETGLQLPTLSGNAHSLAASDSTLVSGSIDKDSSLNLSNVQDNTAKTKSMEGIAPETTERMDLDSHDSFVMESNNSSIENSSGSSGTTIATSERKQPIENIFFLGERSAIVFNLELAQVPHEDLPDDFFELTLEDARTIYKDLKRKRVELEEASLVTGNQRDLKKWKRVLSQLNEYRRTVIRVQFPDRIVLQGIFLPLETVSVVMDFVRGYLENPELDFYLYTTPPKCVLLPRARLVDSECVPSVMVHFGTESQATSGRKTYLKESILTQLTSPSAANLAACRSRGIEPGVRAVSAPTLLNPNRAANVSKSGKSPVMNSEDEAMNLDSGPSTSRQPTWEQGGPNSKVPKS